MKITIVLVSPETSGNIGAIARVMANFDVKKLIITNPKCNHLSKESIDRASHADYILKKAKVINEKNISKLKTKIRKLGNIIIGTTAKLSKDYNILRTVEYINDISEKIAKKNSEIVLLFGRESCGLTNQEIEIADFAITIPTSKKYGSMNLSHSVSICLYELYKNYHVNEINQRKAVPPKQAEIEQLHKLINKSIDNLNFLRDNQDKTLRLVWKKAISKLMLSRREVFALIGYFKKINKKR